MSRKSAREVAFKTIFEIPFHSVDEPVDIINFTVNYAKDELTGKTDSEYFKKVTLMCYDNITEIDNKISEQLKDWTIERLSKVNLSILRLALSEILYCDDIPFQVSINEAVELAKKFGDDDSPAFVNGVLASMIQ